METTVSYFDVNAAYGCTGNKTPDFPEVTDLLAHMDYLSIDRALACCHFRNPVTGNRKLLQDLDRSPETGQRLEPTFIVAPGDMQNSDTLSFYEENLGNKNR